MGIIDQKKLWFTYIHYLNDSSEYHYALHVISEVLKNEYDIHADHEINYEIQSRYFGDVFSFSLSQKGDQLSQWRGYCPNGGYSIRFDDEQLNAMIRDNDLYIGKCLYKKKDQKKLIYEEIVGYTPEDYQNEIYPKAEPWGDPLEEIEGNREIIEAEARHAYSRFNTRVWEHKKTIFQNAMKYAPLIKHKSFREEQEWRIVAISKMAKEFRPGRSFLVPYLRLLLTGGKEQVQLSKVLVGPTSQMELAKESCMMLLKKVEVVGFKITFRNW